MMKRLVLLLAALAATSSGCSPEARTEIMLSIVTDLRAPVPLTNVNLKVYDLDGTSSLPSTDLDWPISGDPDHPFKLPGTFGVYSPDGKEKRIKVVATGTDANNNELMHRTAIFSLVKGKTLFLRLGLVSTCMNNAGCGKDSTCVEGRCTGLDLDSRTFPPWKPGADLQFPCSSGTRFIDTDTKEVLVDPNATCPGAGTCRESTCFTRPPTDGGDEPPPVEAGVDTMPPPEDAGIDQPVVVDAPQDLPADLAPADVAVDAWDASQVSDAEEAGFDGPRDAGEGCESDFECATSYCRQGVCCQTECSGACLSCAVPGSLGTCMPAPETTMCAPPMCEGTMFIPPAYCTGLSPICPQQQPTTCPTGCNLQTNLCNPG